MKHNNIKHGEQLLAIFPDATERDPDKLARKLRRIEVKASALAVDCCNGDLDHDEYKAKSNILLAGVVSLLCPQSSDLCGALFINGDPRGYALKIDSDYVRKHRLNIRTDWGGCGILVPDLS